MAARTLYVTHGNSGDVSTFTIEPRGAPALLGKPVHVGGELRGIVFAPSGDWAYALDTTGNRVVAFSVVADGSLRASPHTASTGARPFGIAIAPGGRTVYTTNTPDGTVSTLKVETSGRLTPLGQPVSTGAPNPRGIALSPDGRFLFTANGIPGDFDPDTVSAFRVNSDATLTLLDDSTAIGAAGDGITVTPDGRFLYVACEWSAEVFGFAIDSDGELTPVPHSPFAAEGFPVGAAAAPDGRHLYIASGGSPVNPDDAVLTHGFAIGTDGALTPTPGSPFVSGSGPVGITSTPDGNNLYVTNVGSDNISAYDIDRAGTLREIAGSPIPTGGDRPLFQSVALRPNQGPVARLHSGASPEGRATTFDATGSLDRDGRIARYDWDFGDGSVLADGGAMPTHAYRQSGTYTVRLLVTDDEGCAAHPVYTGQSLLCNGGAAAAISMEVTVKP
jgi:DNA-binding beta-propeller fold protein YncE